MRRIHQDHLAIAIAIATCYLPLTTTTADSIHAFDCCCLGPRVEGRTKYWPTADGWRMANGGSGGHLGADLELAVSQINMQVAMPCLKQSSESPTRSTVVTYSYTESQSQLLIATQSPVAAAAAAAAAQQGQGPSPWAVVVLVTVIAVVAVVVVVVVVGAAVVAATTTSTNYPCYCVY